MRWWRRWWWCHQVVVVVVVDVADLPSRRCGMVAAWISVMVVKPMSATPWRLASDTDGARPEKQILFRI